MKRIKIKVEVNVPEGKYCNLIEDDECHKIGENSIDWCDLFSEILNIDGGVDKDYHVILKCDQCLKACQEATSKTKETE